MTRYLIGAFALLLAACGSAAEESAVVVNVSCADVIDATIELGSAGYNFDVTVLSADTGWDKYADAWVIRGPDGEVFGERVLAHPHENEQPFTRSLSDVAIPGEVDEVTIAARDSVLGFCGSVLVLEVPRS